MARHHQRMTRRHKAKQRQVQLGMMLVIVGIALEGCFSSAPPLCSFPFNMTAAFLVTVPEGEDTAYDQRIRSFMSAHSLRVVGGTSRASLPPGTPMRTVYQVEGCDGSSYIWSDNSGDKPRDYLVTFNRSPLFKDRTGALRNGFLVEFRRHYRVRPYVDWRS
jgi:hypothetical protein